MCGNSLDLGDGQIEVSCVDECHRPQAWADLCGLDTPVVVTDQHGTPALQQLFVGHIQITHEPTDALRDLDEHIADDAGTAREEQRLIDAVRIHHLHTTLHVDRAGCDRPDRRAVGSPAFLDELPAHRPLIFVDRSAKAGQRVGVVFAHEEIGDRFRGLAELFSPHVGRHVFVVVGIVYPTGHGVQEGHAIGSLCSEVVHWIAFGVLIGSAEAVVG